MKKTLMATAMALAGLAAGCFPESLDYEPNVFLRLPLTQMGISPSQQEIDRWRTAQQAQHDTYPLGEKELNFYLGLLLDCQGQSASLQGLNQFVIIADDNGQKYLDISLLTSECAQGVFKVSLYWLNSEYGLEFFSGASGVLDLPTNEQVTVDVYKHPRASATCANWPVSDPGDYRFAARDVDENVRLPAVISTVTGTSAAFALDDLPIGRTMLIQQYTTVAGAPGIWADASQTFVLTLAGEKRDVCSLDRP